MQTLFGSSRTPHEPKERLFMRLIHKLCFKMNLGCKFIVYSHNIANGFRFAERKHNKTSPRERGGGGESLCDRC